MIKSNKGTISVVGEPKEVLGDLDILNRSIAEIFVNEHICTDMSDAMELLVQCLAITFADVPVKK